MQYPRRFVPRLSQGILLVVGAWVLVASIGLVLVAGKSGSGTRPSGGHAPARSWAEPLIGAQKTTVAGAQAAVGFSVPTPYNSLANRTDLSQVWVNKQHGQVALVFDRGRVTIMMWPATYSNPRIEFQTYIRENRVTASIQKVNDMLALVISPHTDFYKSNPAWIEFDRDGTDVNVVSTIYGTHALMAIANSMH
jgi:hypothetical protein